MPKLLGCVLLFCIALMIGCGKPGPKLIKVKGTATHQGKPLVNLQLNFIPNQGRPGVAFTNDKGEFEVEYDQYSTGMLAGEAYKIYAVDRALTPEEEFNPASRVRAPEYMAVVTKYGSPETGLAIEVPADGKLTLNFD